MRLRTVLAIVSALAAATAGLAYAAAPDPSGVIHACIKKQSGSVRIIDPANDQCLPSETPLSWNQAATGAAGGVVGYEQVAERHVTSGGSFNRVTAVCPAGKVVTGGGFDIETPAEVRVFASEPSDGFGNLRDDRWTVLAENIGTNLRQVTSIAICVSAE